MHLKEIVAKLHSIACEQRKLGRPVAGELFALASELELLVLTYYPNPGSRKDKPDAE